MPMTDPAMMLPLHEPRGPGPAARGHAAERAAAVEFEAVFLSQMLGQMFAQVRTDGPFGGGHAEGVFRGLLVEEYGKSIARAGGIGLADSVAREIIALQEARP